MAAPTDRAARRRRLLNRLDRGLRPRPRHRRRRVGGAHLDPHNLRAHAALTTERNCTMAHNRDDVLRWRGQTMYDNDGDKVGKIDEIYLDQQTGAPEWAVVTTGLFGTKQTFV